MTGVTKNRMRLTNAMTLPPSGTRVTYVDTRSAMPMFITICSANTIGRRKKPGPNLPPTSGNITSRTHSDGTNSRSDL